MTTTQVYEIYIKASPEAIWRAITDPDWTARYGYKGPIEMELRPGGSYRALANEGMRAMGMPRVVIDGVVEEGQKVRQGQVLAEIESDELRAALDVDAP